MDFEKPSVVDLLKICMHVVVHVLCHLILKPKNIKNNCCLTSFTLLFHFRIHNRGRSCPKAGYTRKQGDFLTHCVNMNNNDNDNSDNQNKINDGENDDVDDNNNNNNNNNYNYYYYYYILNKF